MEIRFFPSQRKVLDAVMVLDLTSPYEGLMIFKPLPTPRLYEAKIILKTPHGNYHFIANVTHDFLYFDMPTSIKYIVKMALERYEKEKPADPMETVKQQLEQCQKISNDFFKSHIEVPETEIFKALYGLSYSAHDAAKSMNNFFKSLKKRNGSAKDPLIFSDIAKRKRIRR